MATERSSTGPQILYRTPADVRAIENTQWEAWLRSDTVPFGRFSSERSCQMTLRYVLAATMRRMTAEARA